MGETWDSIADWYADRLAAGSAPHQLAIAAVLQLLPAVTGQPVLDLGCGEGLAARELATQGAQVTGIDLSEQMIGHARRQEAADPLGIEFRVGDAPDPGRPGRRCLRRRGRQPVAEQRRRPRRGRGGGGAGAAAGRLVGVHHPHPCFEPPHASSASTPEGRTAQLVFGYFEEWFWHSVHPQGFRRAGNWHRMLATYLNALVDGGFVITRVLEPEPTPALAASHPGRADVPMFLVVRAARLP